VSIALDAARVPAFDGARALLAGGLRSTAHAPNAESCPLPGLGDAAVDDLVYDPQTAGPLALVVAATDAPSLVAALRERGFDAAVVGRVLPAEDGAPLRLGRGDW
jgi:selenide,water dikinase